MTSTPKESLPTILWSLSRSKREASVSMSLTKKRADDSDPLDVLVLCSQSLYPMTTVRCYPIGLISMMDNGHYDDKIIAIPFSDPTYNTYTDISQIPQHIFEEMSHFFKVYKQLEGKESTTDVNEVCDADKAKKIIAKAIDGYIEGFCK